jgi:hypothetical protein
MNFFTGFQEKPMKFLDSFSKKLFMKIIQKDQRKNQVITGWRACVKILEQLVDCRNEYKQWDFIRITLEFTLKLLCESDESSEEFRSFFFSLKNVLKNWMSKKFFLLKLRNYLMAKTMKLIKLVYNFPLLRHYKNEHFFVLHNRQKITQPMQIQYLF